MSEVVEAALQAQMDELNKVAGWDTSDLLWPDDWTEEQQHAMRIGMNAAIKAATIALRAENELLTEALLTERNQRLAKDAENERLRGSFGALLKERDDLKDSFWRELDRRIALLCEPTRSGE